GEIEIVAVHATTADARVGNERQPGAIEEGTRAFESLHAFGDSCQAVFLGDTARVDRRGQAIVAAIDASQRLRTVDPDRASGAIHVDFVEASAEWIVRDATGQLMMPRKRLGEESAVCANLDAIAKYRQALALENPDPASAMRGKFELDLLRLADGAWTVAEPD